MNYSKIEFKTILEEDNSSDIIIQGYASTSVEDREGDIILANAYKNTIEQYMRTSSAIFYNHDYNRPVGKILDYSITDSLFEVKASIFDVDKYVYEIVKKGIVKAFSVGFIIKDYELKQNDDKKTIRVIKDLDLLDISIVTIPANPTATFNIVKSLYKQIDKDDRRSLLEFLINDFMKKQENNNNINIDEYVLVKKSELDTLYKSVESLRLQLFNAKK